MDFLIGMRQGIGSRFGPSQEFAVELLDVWAFMKDCDFVDDPGYSAMKGDDDDDDDDEEDEDEAATKKKKVKAPPITLLLCSMKDMANQRINSDFND